MFLAKNETIEMNRFNYKPIELVSINIWSAENL